MQLTIQVTKTDGHTYKVGTTLFTIVALERKFKIRASDLEHGVAMEHLAFLAYEASKQANIETPIAFDEFIRQLVSVEVLDGDPVNPSVPAPPVTP